MEKSGFTLLEVSLFLAITSLLALIAFAGLGPRLRNVRFTDAVRSLDSTTQKQLSDFQDGVNNRGVTSKCNVSGGTPQVSESGTNQVSGTSEDCILNGKVALFEKTSVSYFPVVSARKSSASCTPAEPYGSLFCYNPTVILFPSIKQNIDYNKNSIPSAPLIPNEPCGPSLPNFPFLKITNKYKTTTQSFIYLWTRCTMFTSFSFWSL